MARFYYTYDDDDYLVEIFYDGSVVGSADKMINFERDENGNILSVSDSDPALGAGYHQYQYDAADRVVKFVDRISGREHVIDYAYDIHGGIETLTIDGGAATNYARNKRGRTVALDDTAFGAPVGYGYTAAGRLLQVARPNGVDTALAYHDGALSSKADAAAQLTDIGYDNIGRITGRTVGGARYDYQYDRLSRLTEVKRDSTISESFAYDAIGNRTGPGGRSYNARDELLSFDNGAHSFAYDAGGNMTRKIEVGGTTSYGYNVEGRLARVDLPDGAAAEYLYDHAGRRVRKTVTDPAAADEATRFLWSGENVVAEMTDAGDITRRYVWTGFEPVALIETNGTPSPADDTVYWYHTDQIGAPIALTDDAGALSWTGDYQAFGGGAFNKDPDGDGLAITQPWRFPGQYEDPESGLYYNRYRYYDKDGERFNRVDPIGLAGGLNVYAYPSDPISHADPLGLFDPFNFIPPSASEGINSLGASVNRGPARILAAYADLGEALEPYDEALTAIQAATLLDQIPGDELILGALLGSIKYYRYTQNTAKCLKALGYDDVDELVKAAQKALEIVGEGKGHAHGSKVHGAFAKLLKALELKGVTPEKSFMLGENAWYGEKASIRVDIFIEKGGKPFAILDLKTGNAKLTPRRIEQIRDHLPDEFKDIPILPIHP